jgi:hypothetical protein
MRVFAAVIAIIGITFCSGLMLTAFSVGCELVLGAGRCSARPSPFFRGDGLASVLGGLGREGPAGCGGVAWAWRVAVIWLARGCQVRRRFMRGAPA